MVFWVYVLLAKTSDCYVAPYSILSLEQDIQLVISDPKAFNNIIVKDQAIFEQTEASLRYVFPFE
jgi:hypothetical protein